MTTFTDRSTDKTHLCIFGEFPSGFVEWAAEIIAGSRNSAQERLINMYLLASSAVSGFLEESLTVVINSVTNPSLSSRLHQLRFFSFLLEELDLVGIGLCYSPIAEIM